MTGGGLRDIHGAKGLLYLESAAKRGQIVTGKQQVTDLFDNHPFICFDPGRKNDAGVTAVVASTVGEEVLIHAKKHLFVAETRYRETGVDAHIVDPEMKPETKHLKALAQTSGRTRDPEKYKSFGGVFKSDGRKMVKNSCERRLLQKRAKLRNRTTSYWCSINSMILALADSVRRDSGRSSNTGAPIIIFGNPTFSASAKRQRSGAPKKLLRYLKRFFTVVVVGEYNTSKLCPQCQQALHLIDPEGFRMWRCGFCRSRCVNGNHEVYHDFDVNKDISASLNMFHIFYYLMATGERPPEFSRPQVQQPVAENTLQE